MIKIKFEVKEEEEEVTPLPIENENEQIKALLSLNFFGNNNNNSCLSSTNLNNVTSTDNMVPNKPPAVVLMKKPKQLDNSTTESAAVGLNSIKTEPAESSLSLTTQLNNSLNIQNLLMQNRIQNRFRSIENNSIQSIQQANDISMIPNGTQQQQSVILPKIETIVSEILQEVSLSLDQSSSLIPNGTQQQQSLLSTKVEPIVPDNHQEIPLFLDQSFSNLNSERTTNYDTAEVSFSLDQSSSSIPNSWETTTTNCDITTEMFTAGLRADFDRRANKKVPTLTTEFPPPSSMRKQLANKIEEQQRLEKQRLNCGGIRELQTIWYKNQTPEQRKIKQINQKRNYFTRVYGMTNEEVEQYRKLKLQERRLQFNQERMRNLADSAAPAGNLESTNDNDQGFGFGSISGVDPSSASSIQFSTSAAVAPPEAVPLITIGGKKPRKCRQQLLANATPEQRELELLKRREKYRHQMENESEEQRKRRLERRRQYDRMVRRPTKKQQWETMTPEEREKKRAIYREYYKNRKRMMEKKKKESLNEEIGQSLQTSMSLSMSTTKDPVVLDPEIRAKKLRRNLECTRRYKQRLLERATPVQREQIRLKKLEYCRRQRENETEEQRQRRLERVRQYNRTVAKQKRQTMTPEEREKRRAICREKYKKRMMESQISIITNKRKPCKKPRFELLDYDSEDSNGQTTSLESAKPPELSMKLPRPTSFRRKFKSKQYLESSTDTDSDSD